VHEVRAIFHDSSRGEGPVVPSSDALFPPDTPIRIVHADIVGMMVGGITALLLQMLHPHALQGVLDHSDFRADMHGRLRRTARFIAVTTYGHRDAAEREIERVNRIHTFVTGTLPNGEPYSATDPQTLAWVHLAEAWSFLAAHLRYVRPDMSPADQDRYYAQFAIIARKLHAAPVPETRAEAADLMLTMRDRLEGSPQARDVARLILSPRGTGPAAAAQPFLNAAAVDLLPPFARTMLGLKGPGLRAVPTRMATKALGDTLRWAFRR
jgi:uncharacterized protein (DUF2236 family)